MSGRDSFWRMLSLIARRRLWKALPGADYDTSQEHLRIRARETRTHRGDGRLLRSRNVRTSGLHQRWWRNEVELHGAKVQRIDYGLLRPPRGHDGAMKATVHL